MNKIIDYCDILMAKSTKTQKKTQQKIIDDIQRVVKEKQLIVMIVDSELTIKNKRVIWRPVRNRSKLH